MPENFPDEERQLEHAAPAPGLGEKTVQPFQIDLLQPGGCAGGDASHEVESASDADGDCGRQLRATVVDPEILSRVAIGDEKDIWGGAMQGGRDSWPLFFGGGPGIAAGDGEARVEPGKLLRGALGDAGGGAQKKDPPAALGGVRADVVDAVGPGHAFGKPSAQPCGGPEHADAVGHAEIGVCQHCCKGRVAAGIDDELGVDRADLAAGEGFCRQSALLDPAVDLGEGGCKIDAVDRHAQDRQPLGGFRGGGSLAASQSTASVWRAAFSQEKRCKLA